MHIFVRMCVCNVSLNVRKQDLVIKQICSFLPQIQPRDCVHVCMQESTRQCVIIEPNMFFLSPISTER